MKILEINNLKAKAEEKDILKGVDLSIETGTIHAIMGVNGSGKSTLSSVIMGNPNYEVTQGSILYKGENLFDMSVDERARKGIFLAMQYPSELVGVTNLQFLKRAINAKRKDPIKMFDFYKLISKTTNDLKMSEDYNQRFVNVGFSGGEKKRNEILSMLLLKPDLIILDEIDSGLDIDAIKIVGENISKYYNDNKDRVSIIIITHYPRVLEYIKPSYVHVMKDGQIVKTGDYSLARQLEEVGYDDL